MVVSLSPSSPSTRLTLAARTGTTTVRQGEDAAQERPVGADFLALGAPQWRDAPAEDLDADCYEIIRTTDLVFFPVLKRAQQLRSMRVVVHGESKQSEFLQAAVDHSIGLPEAIEWLAKFGPVEGHTFLWLKEAMRRDMLVADLRGAGRHKANAGGTLRLVYGKDAKGNRVERVYKQEEYLRLSARDSGATEAELKAAELPRDRVVVYRPGAGSNPEGDLELAWMLYLLARKAQVNDQNWETYSDKWVLPVWLIRQAFENARPGTMRGKLLGVAQAMQDAPANGAIAVSQEVIVELLKGGTEGATIMDLIEQSINKRAHRLLLHNELTSMTTQGDRGNTLVGKSEQQLVIEAEAVAIGEALDQLLAYLIARNEAAGLMPKLGKNEEAPYIRLEPAPEATRVAPAEARELRKAGPVMRDWFYEQHSAPVPPDLPEVLEQTSQPDPFGLGRFGDPDADPKVDPKAKAGADEDDSDPEPMPTGKPGAEAKLALASRRRRALLEAGDTQSNELAAIAAHSFAVIGDIMAEAYREHAAAAAEGRTYRIPDTTAMKLGTMCALADLAGRARMFREMRTLEKKARLDKEPTRRISVVFRESLELPFEQAIANFTSRAIVPISPAASASANVIERTVSQVYRDHGFTLARVSDQAILTDVKGKLDTFLETGEGSARDFVKWFNERNPELPKSYAETVFRNNVNTGYSAGRARQMRESAQFLGGWEWVTSRDNAVRPAHEALDGKVFPIDRTDLMPPKAHNCRCTAIPVERETKAMPDTDVESVVAKAIEADPGFADWIREPGAGVYPN